MINPDKEKNQRQLIDRISAYLTTGGLFNPELMDHSKVSSLLIDIRDHLEFADTVEEDKQQGDAPETHEMWMHRFNNNPAFRNFVERMMAQAVSKVEAQALEEKEEPTESVETQGQNIITDEVLRKLIAALTCRDGGAHYCPNCDNSLFNAKVIVEAAYDSRERCEGCGAIATVHDTQGVPLCAACAALL